MDLLQLVVQYLPLGVHDVLVLLHAVDADLGVVALRLELELDVEQRNERLLVALLLHLEAGVGEGLLERDAGDEARVLQGASLHLLDADHVERQQLVEQHDRVHHHGREELLAVRDQLGAERGGGALEQQAALLALVVALHLDRDLLDLVDGHSRAVAQRLDYELRVHALLDERLQVAQYLGREQHHARRAVAHLGVLRLGYVHQSATGRMHDLEQIHDRRSVIRYCRLVY